MDIQLGAPVPAPPSTRPRFIPVTNDSVEPLARRGDFLAVVPVDRFIGEGVYAIMTIFGTMEFVVAQSRGLDTPLLINRVNRKHCSGAWDMAWDAFAEVVLGKVAAACKVVDLLLVEAM